MVLGLLGSTLPSWSAIKEGSVCKKPQQVRVVKKIEFKCTKQGSKFVWQKRSSLGVDPSVESTPGSSANQNTKVATTPSPAPSPIAVARPLHENPDFARILWSRKQDSGGFLIDSETFAIPSEIPNSWDDIFEKRDGIAYKAWQSVAKVIATSPANIGVTKRYQGPNSVLTFSDIEGVFELTSRAFPKASAVPNTNIFIYNYRDRNWADSTFRQIYQNEDERFNRHSMNSVLDNCQEQREVCWQMAFTDSRMNGVVLLGVIERGSPIDLEQTYSGYARSFLGFVIAHEYFHILQRRAIGDKWFQREFGPPIWFGEGSAVFIENAVMNHESFDKFMRFRLTDSKLAYPGCEKFSRGCFTLDEDILGKFFSLRNYEDNWNSFPYGMKYEVSSRIIEILAAVKGHQSILELYEEIAKGKPFSVAFEKVFGIPYEKATPLISRILLDQYRSNK
jgi:hypothetical protein